MSSDLGKGSTLSFRIGLGCPRVTSTLCSQDMPWRHPGPPSGRTPPTLLQGLESAQSRTAPDILAGAPCVPRVCVISGAENQQKRHHTACLPQGDPAFLLHTSQLHPTGSISTTLIPPNPGGHCSLAHGPGQPEKCPQRDGWLDLAEIHLLGVVKNYKQ